MATDNHKSLRASWSLAPFYVMQKYVYSESQISSGFTAPYLDVSVAVNLVNSSLRFKYFIVVVILVLCSCSKRYEDREERSSAEERKPPCCSIWLTSSTLKVWNEIKKALYPKTESNSKFAYFYFYFE